MSTVVRWSGLCARSFVASSSPVDGSSSLMASATLSEFILSASMLGVTAAVSAGDALVTLVVAACWASSPTLDLVELGSEAVAASESSWSRCNSLSRPPEPTSALRCACCCWGAMPGEAADELTVDANDEDDPHAWVGVRVNVRKAE